MSPRRDLALLLIGLGVVIGLLFASADRPGWEKPCEGGSLMAACSLLALATIAAANPARRGRAPALGFAVAGWTYFVAARWYTYHEGPLPTVAFLAGAGQSRGEYRALPPIVHIVHDAWTLAFAVAAALVAGLLFRYEIRPPAGAGEPAPESDLPRWWRRPAAVGTIGLSLIAVATWLGWRISPETGASVGYLLTWTGVGIAVLGAMFGRGRRRAAWLGAAAPGVVYLLLAFGPYATPELPTNNLLHAVLSPGGPKSVDPLADLATSDDPDVRRIARALEETRVTLRFLTPTSLDQVLEPIRRAVAGATGLDLRFHESFEDFPYFNRKERPLVTIDRTDVSAREALRLCLEPVARTYLIRPGYLRIVPDTYRPLAPSEDPTLIAGHCTLALLLAAIGAIASSILGPCSPVSA